MDQGNTPVFDGLLEYIRKQKVSFHVPGHKGGLVFPEKAAPFFRQVLPFDATEVANLDDLSRPTGILREGEALLSDYYGTRSSYYLVNGSTVGNLIMVLAACARGDTVFVQRDSHKSVFNALQLAGVRPVFLAPAIDPGSGLAAGIAEEAWEAAIRRFPETRALILTYPNYYGMAPDVGQLIEKAHAAGLSVLVDEAHGPHFKMGPPVPPSTLDMGADLVVHSAHKMLPAMTMGAYLHINTARVPAEKVEAIREMLQTSSPSYAIMASLDLARYYMANLDQTERSRIFAARNAFVRALKDMEKIHVLEPRPGLFRLDPFKITLELDTGESGFDWQERLIASGVYPELADPHHVLFTLGLTGRIDYRQALSRMARTLRESRGKAVWHRPEGALFPKWTTIALPYGALSAMEKQEIKLNEAAGRIAAEHVVPYPPGIPAVVRGERVTEESLKAIESWKSAGAVFQNRSIDSGRINVYRTGEI
ncbi:aminotransferase class I/II-fold pyridoxal phosphate-dependent enzyme [Sporolactobacillus sp. THM7-7]|nr:aminotransferase class I/II-fold pyridoxal phosphate-dependent enzyme [Sporolactobacillus sp. THM7-7]